ncbi:MAG: hypothetical protein Aurels2KO_55550 [Aureliella sp.]
MNQPHDTLTAYPRNGFRPNGYRVVHFLIRGDVFNRAKAKAIVLNLSLAEYVAGLMERDSFALTQLTDEGTDDVR